MKPKLEAFERLLKIIDELRVKCPWDRKQTIQSLRNATIEEVYELAEAILKKDYDEIKEELGDMAMHLIFYARIASETKKFDIADVLNGICDKLIARHPHIYGNIEVKNENEVIKNWERLKQEEKKHKKKKSILSGIAQGLPSMVKAERIQKKAHGAGFDFEKTEDAWQKVREEIQELEVSLLQNKIQDSEAEFGDLFFSLINVARLMKIDPDAALEKTTQKFTKRFNYLELQAKKNNQNFYQVGLNQLEAWWQESKQYDN